MTSNGQYEYLRMLFHIVCVPAVFQRLINNVLGPFRFNKVFAYMGDVLILSERQATFLEHLGKPVYLSDYRNVIYFHTNFEYLGQEISQNSMRPGNSNTKAIRKFPVPHSVNEVDSF